MPDLPTRAERERALAAALLAVFNGYAAIPPRSIPTGNLRADLRNAVSDELAASFSAAASGLAVSRDWGIPEDRILAASAFWAGQFADALAGEIADNSWRFLQDGRPQEIIFGAERASKISATETTRAIGAGENWAAAFAGVYLLANGDGAVPTRLWHTAEDELVCEECGPLNGQPESIWASRFPLGPPAHPHCRCWLDWA